MSTSVLFKPWISVAIVLLLSCAVQGAEIPFATDPTYFVDPNLPEMPLLTHNKKNETIMFIPRLDEPTMDIRLEPRGNVMCYECSSLTHPLCDDPFNFTLSIDKGPPVAACDGCCVKLVQHIGTRYASIRRTCTKKMQINLFVVDRVCMREGGGRGHMCFCNEDLCNAAPSSLLHPSSSTLGASLFFLLISTLAFLIPQLPAHQGVGGSIAFVPR